ncbi:hypothetical protein A6A08_21330 [Nocardiopsis sp. TSRI0078]|uniref:hypothetical protein n=1 Tax=unclassified Nocardiopsis TaxID=2649073 RepID=UPI00093E9F99|nr:hypothetical protein [Nocardiopsis sp. TSRI0078]OKI21370.1 hypothetical protein A6A08_21330 [Nocardiopsis sp. TSRI0078]
MAWDVSDDHDQYMAAYQLHMRHRGRWLVMWAPGARVFFAFYRGRAHVVPLSEPTSQELHRQILRTETSLATTEPAYWSCPSSACSWTSSTPTDHHCPWPPG